MTKMTDSEIKTIRLSATDREQLRELARQSDRSQGAIVRMLIRKASLNDLATLATADPRNQKKIGPTYSQ